METGSIDAVINALNNIETKPVELQPENKIKIGVITYMGNVKGVDNIVTALNFLEKVGNVIHDLKKSGVTLLEELTGFLPLTLDLSGFISALPKIAQEAADEITTEEKNQIEAIVLKSDYIQDIIAKGGADKQTVIDDHITELINLKNFLFKYYINGPSSANV